MILESAIFYALRDADRAATLAVNDSGGAFTDAVMPVISSHAFIALVYALLLSFILWKFGWRKALTVLLVAGVTLLLADQAANLVKYSVQRLRPCWDDDMVSEGLRILERKGSKFGFWSAHAATATGVITVVLMLVRFWDGKRPHKLATALGVVWILLVSVSRVYVGKHFVGDILAGMAAGFVISFALSLAARWLIRRYFTKFAG